ncbi:hypothetical protein YPC_0936 [Yersinia pestis biovar Medievalis str. Harbin 35]|nr:hypothetical protein YPC_0936 [Yersinia pestis biovar Medievalis str. Harbin 35]EEO75561.1 hypothetical protein YP516_3486 [Yersinia pestis Nepal516]EEO83023.1 hypothetical protein YPF_1003 [Yersinia pestis biovar Orientalis str. India 195]EEO87195.1 hypothetical protein YPH_3130 [Yersinia pestis biovar Orientalis str. PEXU2]EEO91258.1 hypothetical protein YPS_1482 [Yersinia pestis Pestoides A]
METRNPLNQLPDTDKFLLLCLELFRWVYHEITPVISGWPCFE